MNVYEVNKIHFYEKKFKKKKNAVPCCVHGPPWPETRPLPFPARWIAPRVLQGLAGQICLGEPLTLSASILSKQLTLRELKSLSEIFYSSLQRARDGASVLNCDSCRPVVLQLPP